MEEQQRLKAPAMDINPSLLTLKTSSTVRINRDSQTISPVSSDASMEASPPRLTAPKRAAVSTPEDASQSPKKRHCVSMACMPCRERRLKCDGERPTCGACKDVPKPQSTCRYDPTQDFRRKSAMRNRIVELEKSQRDLGAFIGLLRRCGDGAPQVVTSIRNMQGSTDPHLIVDHVVRDVILQEDTQLSQPLFGDATSPMSHYDSILRFPWKTDEDHLPTSSAPEVSDWTTVTSDNDLVTELLDVYFTWSHPFYLLFSEETFYHGMRNRKVKYCTPLLMNVVLAIGCVYSDCLEARKFENDLATAGDHFFDEAKLLLANEQGMSLPTIQALGLMSVREAMRNESTQSRVYISHMIEGIKTLQLHVLPPPGSPRKISEAEVQARTITLWGCYCLETSSALSNRRLTALSGSSIELHKPLILPELENTPWKPYGTLHYDGGDSEMAQASNKYSILLQSSLLAGIVDEITTLLFSSDNRVEDEQLNVRHERFQMWFQNLPAELDVQNQHIPLPQVIALHCYYHYCVIQLFRRPLMFSFLQHATPPPQACVDAASRISQLMYTYSKIYGTDKSYSILPRCLTFAAIVHVLCLDNSLFSSSKQKWPTELFLSQAIMTLHEMKATRCLKVVRDLIETWDVTIPAAVRISLNQIGLESTIGALTVVPNSADGTGNVEDWSMGNEQENENEFTDNAPNAGHVAWEQSWTSF